jgi:hypothetical protein
LSVWESYHQAVERLEQKALDTLYAFLQAKSEVRFVYLAGNHGN